MTGLRFLRETSAPLAAALLVASPASANPCFDMQAGQEVGAIGAEAFVRTLRAAALEPKGARESQSAYDQRASRDAAAFLRDNPYFVIRKPILGGSGFQYDLARGELRYRDDRAFACGEFGERLCLEVYRAGSGESYDIAFVPPTADYDPYPPMKATPERARSIRDGEAMRRGTVDLVMVVVPEPPFVEASSRRALVRMPVRILCTGWSVAP